MNGNNGPFSPFHNPFSQEHLEAIKGMVEQYNQVLTDDFWQNIYGLNVNRNHRSLNFIPVDIWETVDQFYVIAAIPGIRDTSNIKISFPESQKVMIKCKFSSFRPRKSSSPITKELPKDMLQREIRLPYPVKTRSHTSSYHNGVLKLVLTKDDPDLDIPLEFE